MKANNGIYLIDDFGRQRATPAEVLNRWIVPMERRVDYLSFLTGGKMTAPFEAFLVFSTNLNPADLGDEAFLRRIQYKMLLKAPAENEFIRIFEAFCTARKLPFSRDLIQRFIEKHYRQTGKAFRRCHPRDVLSHALNLMHFEKLPFALTDEILDRAFDSCFLQKPRPRRAAAPAAASHGKSRKSHHAGDVAVLRRLLGRPGGPDQHRLRHPGLRRRIPQPRHRLLSRSRFLAAVRRNRNFPRPAEAPPARFPGLAQPQFRSAEARPGPLSGR